MTYPQYHSTYNPSGISTYGAPRPNPLTRNQKIAIGVGAGALVLGVGGFIIWSATKRDPTGMVARKPSRTVNP